MTTRAILAMAAWYCRGRWVGKPIMDGVPGIAIHTRKVNELAKDAGHREQTDAIVGPFEKVLALFLQIVRLDQHGPGIRRHIISEVAAVERPGVRRGPGETEQIRGRQVAEAALGGRGELPDGINLIAKKLAAVRCFGIRCIDVKNAAAPARPFFRAATRG